MNLECIINVFVLFPPVVKILANGNVVYHTDLIHTTPNISTHSIKITESLVMLLHYFGIFSVSWSTKDFNIIKFSEF